MPIEDYPNLIPNSARTPEQLREQTRKAGRASGEARRRRKTFRESLLTILAMDVDDPAIKEKLEALGLDPSFQTAIDLAQIRQAVKGDTDASRFVRDTVGEKPSEALEIGNLDGRPFESLDLKSLSDEQLQALAAARQDG